MYGTSGPNLPIILRSGHVAPGHIRSLLEDCPFMRTRSLASAIFVLCLTLVLTIPASAQTVLGSITGTVKDATGAAVSGAAVSAENIGTNLNVATHSDGNGSYLIPN